MSINTKAGQKPAQAKKAGRAGFWLAAGGTLVILLLVVLGWYALRARPAAKESGPPAPDFTVPTLKGGTFTLSEQHGKPVILFAMAYWCGTCVPEAQALAQLHQKYGERVSIIALDVDPSSTPESLQQFRDWVGQPDYVWAFDRDNRVVEAYQIRALDTTFIIDQAGGIVYTDAYPTPYQTLEEQIQKLLR